MPIDYLSGIWREGYHNKTRSHKTVISGEVIVRSGLTLYWKRMNETYIDNLDAIAVEQTMNGIRLSIGHEAYIMPLAIARTMCIAIQVKCFQVHQLEVEATMTRQLKTLK